MHQHHPIIFKALIITMLLCTQTVFAQNADGPKLRSDNIEAVLNAMTVEEKVSLLVGGAGTTPDVPNVAGYTRTIPRLGIPMTALSDGPAGLRIDPTREGTDQTFYCTCFPNGTLIASSWDPAMVEQMTQAMGNDIYQNIHSNDKVREAVRQEQLREYVKKHNLDVKYYQDYGWPAVEL